MPYIPHTPEEQQEMLAAIGVPDMSALFADIPEALKPQSFDIPEGQSEMNVLARMEELAGRNSTDLTSFLGAGFYDHFNPTAIKALSSRENFSPRTPPISQRRPRELCRPFSSTRQPSAAFWTWTTPMRPCMTVEPPCTKP